MPKILNLGCIQCEDRGCVVATKAGYRCTSCGSVWQKDGNKKPVDKSAPSKDEG